MSKDGNYNVNHGLMVFFNHIHLSLCWRIVQSCLVTERSQNDSTDAFQANITACVTVIKKKSKVSAICTLCIIRQKVYIFVYSLLYFNGSCSLTITQRKAILPNRSGFSEVGTIKILLEKYVSCVEAASSTKFRYGFRVFVVQVSILSKLCFFQVVYLLNRHEKLQLFIFT